MLVTMAVVALVVASLAVGGWAAHRPFWLRAWQWHAASDYWPAQLPGPTEVLRPSAAPLPLHVAFDERLAPRVGDGFTRLLIVGDVSGWAAHWSAPTETVQSPVDGRGLGTGLLAPLFGALQQQAGAPLLDRPLRQILEQWRDDDRGAITPRQLLWEMSGLAAEEFSPLNPFSRRAQLASGPNFDRAARHTRLAWPPGSHFEPSPVNAQLLSLAAGLLDGDGYAAALQRHLWSRFAEFEATGVVDHRRGSLAAHCCLRAAPLDWIRLGLVLAADGVVGQQRLLPAGYVSQMVMASPVHPAYGLGYQLGESRGGPTLVLATSGRRLVIAPRTGRAALWVGEGDPPMWMDELLARENFVPM
jgi:hypothetical protein